MDVQMHQALSTTILYKLAGKCILAQMNNYGVMLDFQSPMVCNYNSMYFAFLELYYMQIANHSDYIQAHIYYQNNGVN